MGAILPPPDDTSTETIPDLRKNKLELISQEVRIYCFKELRLSNWNRTRKSKRAEFTQNNYSVLGGNCRTKMEYIFHLFRNWKKINYFYSLQYSRYQIFWITDSNYNDNSVPVILGDVLFCMIGADGHPLFCTNTRAIAVKLGVCIPRSQYRTRIASINSATDAEIS